MIAEVLPLYRRAAQHLASRALRSKYRAPELARWLTLGEELISDSARAMGWHPSPVSDDDPRLPSQGGAPVLWSSLADLKGSLSVIARALRAWQRSEGRGADQAALTENWRETLQTLDAWWIRHLALARAVLLTPEGEPPPPPRRKCPRAPGRREADPRIHSALEAAQRWGGIRGSDPLVKGDRQLGDARLLRPHGITPSQLAERLVEGRWMPGPMDEGAAVEVVREEIATQEPVISDAYDWVCDAHALAPAQSEQEEEANADLAAAAWWGRMPGASAGALEAPGFFDVLGYAGDPWIPVDPVVGVWADLWRAPVILSQPSSSENLSAVRLLRDYLSVPFGAQGAEGVTLPSVPGTRIVAPLSGDLSLVDGRLRITSVNGDWSYKAELSNVRALRTTGTIQSGAVLGQAGGPVVWSMAMRMPVGPGSWVMLNTGTWRAMLAPPWPILTQYFASASKATPADAELQAHWAAWLKTGNHQIAETIIAARETQDPWVLSNVGRKALANAHDAWEAAKNAADRKADEIPWIPLAVGLGGAAILYGMATSWAKGKALG